MPSEQQPDLRFWESLLKHRTVHLSGEIDDATAKQVIANLLFLEMDKPRESVTLLIDSHGGGVTQGLAIADTLVRLETPVSTHCTGVGFGMAALVLAVGEKGLRRASPGARIGMGPLWSSGEPPVPRALEDVQRVNTEMVARLCRATGRPSVAIRRLMESETWLSAAEALQQGFVDVIDELDDDKQPREEA